MSPLKLLHKSQAIVQSGIKEDFLFIYDTTLKSLIEEQTGINEQAWKKSATLLAYY